MNIEYEARVLEINVEEVEKKLRELGAVKEEVHDFRRHTYDLKPAEEMSWIRLRTNGKKTTLTIKEVTSHTVDGTKELEVEVEDFDEMNRILERLGFNYKSYQENRRISYKLDGVCVEIDSWPLIPTYMEIEGKSEEDVYRVAEMLGYKKEDLVTLDVSSIYLNVYGIDIDSIKVLKYDEENR